MESQALASPELSESELTVEPGYLHIVASDFDARPMTYVTPEGDRLGYEPDLARSVCERLGLTPVWHNLPMEDFYRCFAEGGEGQQKYDLLWFNQAITPERQQVVTFTQPYGLFNEAVLVKDSSPVSSPEMLADQRVGGLADSTNIALVETFPGAVAVPYPGSDQVLPEMLAALRAGDIDALIDDELVLLVAAEDDPSLKVAFTLPTQVPFAIGLPPARAALLQKLDQTLSALKADGTMAGLWAQWIPWQPFPLS